MRKIRVLIVDDSIFFRTFLAKELSADPNIEIVGSAINAADAKTKIDAINPDVVTLDVEMPGMSGIDFLKTLIPVHPVPVVLVSSLNIRVFDALSAGAVEFVRKPDTKSPQSVELFIDDLTSAIVAASSAKIRRSGMGPRSGPGQMPIPGQRQPEPLRPAPGRPPAGVAQGPAPAPSQAPTAQPKGMPVKFTKNPLLVLGASTGGTEATLTVLKDLPKETPGMLIVQHMPPGFTKMYAERLNRLCPMEVREAKTGDRVEQGVALIAPGDCQMTVVSMGNGFGVRCAPGEKVSGHCPSVDVLFRSAARAAKANAVGIIMTGMGRDGADGLLEMKRAGAFTIGQDEASSVVYGMPMEAYNLGAVTRQAACENIAFVLKSYLSGRQV